MAHSASISLGRRFRVLALLGGAGALLVALRLLIPGSSPSAGGNVDGPGFRKELVAAIDSLLELHGIDRRGVRTRSIALPGGTALRTEQRIDVPDDFVSLQFNHEMATRLRRTGARVIGTERVREGLTSLHIVRGGATVWTLQFVRKSKG